MKPTDVDIRIDNSGIQDSRRLNIVAQCRRIDGSAVAMWVENISVSREEFEDMAVPLSPPIMCAFLKYLILQEGKTLTDAVFIMLNGGKKPLELQVEDEFTKLKEEAENGNRNVKRK